jgi:hypothetical protein
MQFFPPAAAAVAGRIKAILFALQLTGYRFGADLFRFGNFLARRLL